MSSPRSHTLACLAVACTQLMGPYLFYSGTISDEHLSETTTVQVPPLSWWEWILSWFMFWMVEPEVTIKRAYLETITAVKVN